MRYNPTSIQHVKIASGNYKKQSHGLAPSQKTLIDDIIFPTDDSYYQNYNFKSNVGPCADINIIQLILDCFKVTLRRNVGGDALKIKLIKPTKNIYQTYFDFRSITENVSRSKNGLFSIWIYNYKLGGITERIIYPIIQYKWDSSQKRKDKKFTVWNPPGIEGVYEMIMNLNCLEPILLNLNSILVNEL